MLFIRRHKLAMLISPDQRVTAFRTAPLPPDRVKNLANWRVQNFNGMDLEEERASNDRPFSST